MKIHVLDSYKKDLERHDCTWVKMYIYIHIKLFLRSSLFFLHQYLLKCFGMGFFIHHPVVSSLLPSGAGISGASKTDLDEPSG